MKLTLPAVLLQNHFLKRISFLLATLFLVQAGLAQTTIAVQDFETVPATPTLTFSNTNGAYSTGTNPAAGIPANANLFSGGARGWQAVNTTSTLTFTNQSLAGYVNNFVDFRLAGMSVNNSNGIDGGDIATVFISVDGGTTYSSELTIAGSTSNRTWDFTATGSTTITYDGDNTPTAVTSSSGSGGISTVTINIPNTATQVSVRIVLTNDNANERWVIDDVRIRGIACTAPSDPTGTINPGANPACGSTTLNYSAGASDVYWQTSASGTSTANPTTSNLTITTTGTYYVRRYNGTCWSTNALSSGTITVNPVPGVTVHPSSPAAVCGSYSGSLSVTATGANLQWEYSADGSTGWAAVANNTPNSGVTYTGGTSTSLSIASLTQTGYYRCVATSTGCTSATSNVATVTVNALPANPTGSITPAANPACTSTTLSYSNPSASIYWQTTALGTSTVYPTTSDFTASTTGSNNYYVRAYDGVCWSATSLSTSAPVVINTAPAISANPSSPAAVCGTYSGSLAVTATGTNLTYQWQYSADGSTGWASVANNTPNAGVTYTNPTSATMPIAGLTQTGYYRCVVSNAGCTAATSNVATVTVNTIPATPTGSITPAANPACTSTTLNYSGASANIYWQTTSLGTSTANPTTTDLTVSTVGSNTYYVRAYTGFCWSPASLASAAIVINTAPAISTNPSSPAAVCGTYSGSLAVTATGTNLTYQWQYSADGSTGWASVANNTPNAGVTYTNPTSATMPIAGLTQTAYYRCVVSNAGCTAATSNVATVTVNTIPATPTGSITPAANPACTSTTLSYSNPSASIYWQTTALGTSTANPTTSNLTINSTGIYYVRSYNGSCWSTGSLASSTITINTPVVITSDPSNTTVTSPATSSFSVTATGSVASYQWQVNDGSGWVNASGAPYSGTNLATLTINPSTTVLDGYAYRCVITATAPCASVTSNPAILTVLDGPCVSDVSGYTGWTLSGATSSSIQSCSGNGLLFTASGQYAITTSVTNPLLLNFNKKRSNTATAWSMDVQISTSASGPWTTVATVSTITNSCTAHPTIDLSSYTGVQYIRFLDTRASGAEQRGIDDITITCGSSCIPTHSISSFTPTSGPAGTIVTITGTNFTGATAVKFGGISSTSYTVVNATTIQAEVPAGALSGKIGITVGGCEVLSSSSFSVLTQNANCGNGTFGTGGLMISEVFDSQAGSLSYIEIFNPTSSSVSLTNYSLRIVTDGPTNTDYSLGSASIPSGGVYIISIGDPSASGSTVCGSVTANLSFPLGSGFNGNDRVVLRFNGSDHDVVNNPNYGSSSSSSFKGFSQLRNQGIVNPSTSYNSSEWTNSTVESCSHLGIAPTSLSSSNVTISSQPADVSCASVSFSVTATSTPGPIDYVWYYQQPGSATWDLVSNLNGSTYTVTGSGTNSIIITGNTANLKDYQFYCEVQSGGSPECSKYTNAVQFTYATLPVYRSKQSGNWRDVSTWEYANSISGPWSSPVCTYPIASNSSEVIIQNTHKVVLDNNTQIDIDKVTIDFGGELEISTSNSSINFLNSQAGADFIVNGTLTDRGSSGNGVLYAAGASWTMGSNATVVKTNSSSAANYRDFYEGGISTIPNGSSGAKFIYRFNGDGNPSVVSAGMFYPNLYFEKETAGTYDFNSSINSVLTGGSGGFCTVKGNMFVGTTGGGSVITYNNNINASSMMILGNLTIGNGSTLTNASYNGGSSATYGNGTGFEVKGNVTVNGTFTVTGTTGNVGLLTLSGSNAQTVSGSGTLNLYSVTINNTSATGVTLGRPVTMNGVLTLTDGYVNTDPTNILSLTATATCPVGGSQISFVTGPMQKTGSSDFIFPVGKPAVTNPHYTSPTIMNGGFRPISITNLTGSDTYTAEFKLNNPTIWPISAAAAGDGLQGISSCEYWDLTRSGSTNATVTLSWSSDPAGHSQCNVGSYVDNIPSLVVVPYYNGQWGDQNATRFGQSGYSGTAVPTGPNYLSYISWGDGTAGTIDSYLKFVLGTIDTKFNPLVSGVKTFKATGKQKKVYLDWTITSNDKYDTYFVERSKDGIHFETILTVAAIQGTTIASYNDIDHTPNIGWNYYRLRLRDNEQKTYYSEIQKVWIGSGSAIEMGPVPAHQNLNIYFSDPGSVLELQLVSSVGQILYQTKTIRATTQVNVSHLPAGIYYMRFVGKTETTVKPFTKQ